MGKLKGILSIAEAATAAGQRGAKVRNLDGAGNVIADLNKTNAGSMPDLPPLEVGRPTEIRAEISQAEETAERLTRAHHINDADADPIVSLSYQTSTPEEFATRYRKQLVDPVTSVKAVNEGRIPDEDYIMRLETRRSAYEHQSSLLKHRVGKAIPRWRNRVDEYVGDSPYKFDVMYHLERTTDPTADLAKTDDFIQYHKPRELGVHAGTNEAAEGMLDKGSLEDLLMRQEEIGKDMHELAGFTGIPLKKLERIMGNEVTAHINRKFKANQSPDFDPDEWTALVGRIENQLGIDAASEAATILGRMKHMPTSNTTPTIFRGKNGLLLQDRGGFGPEEVRHQLEMLYPDDVDELLAIRGGGIEETNLGLQKFIESKGFDHVIYHNSVEDKGMLSIINWNPDLMKSVYHADFAGGNTGQGAAAAAAAFMAVMGLTSADIRED